MAVTQRIRGPRLELLDKWPLSSYDALKKAGDENRVIVSNNRIKQAIPLIDAQSPLRAAFPCWTGTMAAFPEFGISFRLSKMYSRNDDALVYVDYETGERWLFLLTGIPDRHVNAWNALLVVEHPDYSIEKSGGSLVVRPQFPEKAGIIAPFAYVKHQEPYRDDGFYIPDPTYGIPAGYNCFCEPNSSYLFLSGGDSSLGRYGRVGLVSSSLRADHVDLGIRPSWGCGVLVEAP